MVSPQVSLNLWSTCQTKSTSLTTSTETFHQSLISELIYRTEKLSSIHLLKKTPDKMVSKISCKRSLMISFLSVSKCHVLIPTKVTTWLKSKINLSSSVLSKSLLTTLMILKKLQMNSLINTKIKNSFGRKHYLRASKNS